MKRKGRFRRIAKWTGVGACALILTAWFWSHYYLLLWRVNKEIVVVFGSGTGGINWEVGPPRVHFEFEIVPLRSAWRSKDFPWPVWQYRKTDLTFRIPCWMLLIVTGMPTIILFYRDRRKILPGHCKQCGYDLRTMTGGRCPECGLAPAAKG